MKKWKKNKRQRKHKRDRGLIKVTYELPFKTVNKLRELSQLKNKSMRTLIIEAIIEAIKADKEGTLDKSLYM